MPGTARENRVAAHSHIKGLGLREDGVADQSAAGFIGQQQAREVRLSILSSNILELWCCGRLDQGQEDGGTGNAVGWRIWHGKNSAGTRSRSRTRAPSPVLSDRRKRSIQHRN
jgi:hypothetical protein